MSVPPERVLVTGGAGFIGSSFLERSIPRWPRTQFVNVDCLSYAAVPGSLARVDGAPNYRFERIDVTDAGAIAALVRELRPQLIVHLAAETDVDWSIEGPGAFVRTNVVGTLSLLEAWRAHLRDDDPLFVHVSTDEIYGSISGTGRFDVDAPARPSSPYAASKAAADHLVGAYVTTYGLRACITRCSNNYGPRQFPEKLIPLMICNALVGRPLPVYGDGRNVRDWIHVDDHCDALWAVADRGRPGAIYNVGADCERHNLDVVHAVCRAVADETGRPLAQLVASIEHVRDRPGHDRRYAIDSSRIAADCGWRAAASWDDGLRATVRWYVDNPEWVARARTVARPKR